MCDGIIGPDDVAKNNHFARKNWQKTDILVVDEISMMSSKYLAVLNRLGQRIRKNNRPFGGIQVIFCGDFCQLSPIGDKTDPETFQFCFESPIWNEIFPPENQMELTKVYRQTDPKYIEILSQIRQGELSDENEMILSSLVGREIPNEIVPPKLFSTRLKVKEVNDQMFRQIQEPIKEYQYVVDPHATEYLNSGKKIPLNLQIQGKNLSEKAVEYEIRNLLSSCEEILELKLGAIVMCIVNYDMDRGICNGLQGMIVGFERDLPVVKYSNGQVLTMPRYKWQSEKYPCITISQIPLRLSWAMTIHKIQGASLDMAEIDVGDDIFAEGQTYVALSRVKTLDGLYLTRFNAKKIKANPKVLVFYEKLKKEM
jgi:ATP-dependent DNA helicase PIF1